jgi:hypothetical protein
MKKILQIVLSSLVAVLAVYFIAAAWTGPTLTPPDGNISACVDKAPIASPTFTGTAVTPAIKITTGAALGKVLTSDADGLASWTTLAPSQWTTSGSNIYYNSGNVGIGTTNPGEKLEVSGNVKATQIKAGNGSFGYTASGDSWTGFDLTGSNKRIILGVSQGQTRNIFDIEDTTNWTHWMELRADGSAYFAGNVGIGTANPGYKLDVQGTGNFLNTLTLTGSGDTTYNINSWQAMGRYAGWDANMLYLDGYGGFTSGVSVGSPGASTAKFQVYGGTSYFGGNVGIGTANPGAKLVVSGGNARFSAVSEGWSEGIRIEVPRNQWGGVRLWRGDANFNGNWYIGYKNDSTDDLAFGSNNAGTQVDNILYLTKAGNVGIGTANPGATLDINGTIRGATWGFGGMYSVDEYAPRTPNGSLNNPITGAQSCPPGFTATRVGRFSSYESGYPDNLYMCWK